MDAGAGEAPGLASIAELLAQRAGIAFGPHTSDALARASRRLMTRHTLRDLEQLAVRLQADPACFASLLDEVTVGETYFFRNPEHFELVRSELLPALRALREPEHVLQLWSAGCATGEEPYSLAMLLDGEGLLERARVLASDIAPRALERARIGRYREWSLRGLDPLIQRRWLQTEGDHARVCERIRRSVVFSQLNLAEPGYSSQHTAIGGLDLIFCRNVLIYFDAATIAAVEHRLYEALAPGGFAILGPSDPMLGRNAPFEVEISEQGLYYRRPGAPVHALEQRAPSQWPARPASGAPARIVQAETAVGADRGQPPRERASALDSLRAVWRAEGAGEALRGCQRALLREALNAELHYLHALLLLDLGRDEEALEAARRTLYLEPGLAIAQFTLGSILERAGRPGAARRPYRNALDAAAACPSDEALPLADGVLAGALASAARAALVRLGEG